jgi:hypothetical protein
VNRAVTGAGNSPWDLADRALLAAALAGCAAMVGLVAWVIARRWDYPFDLEWIEGFITQAVQRLVGGQPLYPEPSPEWVRFVYTPLYYWLSALAARVHGHLDLPLLRLFSMASTLVSAGGLALLAMRSTRQSAAALLALGLFAAAFKPCGFWFDLVRPDMLMLAFLSLAFLAAWHAETPLMWAGSAVLGALAFWSKQPALFPLVGLAVLAARRGRPHLAAFGATALACIGLPLMLMHQATQGWSSFYLFSMADTPTMMERIRIFFLDDMLFQAWPMIAMAAGVIVLPAPRRLFWLAVLIACGLASFGGRFREGGYLNVLLPLYAALSVAAIAGAYAWRQALGRWGLLIWLLFPAQAALSWFPARAQVPSQADRAYWQALVEKVASIPGHVWIPTTAFCVQQPAHKGPTAMWLVAEEMERMGRPAGQAFRAAMKNELEKGRVSALVLTQAGAFGFEDLFKGWRSVPFKMPNQGPLDGHPVTGWQVWPDRILYPPAHAGTRIP